MLNCKKGDLAIIVKSYAGNEGKIVRCVDLVQPHPLHIERGPRWLVDRPIKDSLGRVAHPSSMADACLRPLRDTPGEDETLRGTARYAPITTTN